MADDIPRADEVGGKEPIFIDNAVSKHFPEGAKLVVAQAHGTSFWSRTAFIDIELTDGTPDRLFLKTADGELGMSMLRGEYHGAKTIYKYTPEGIPQPLAWGTYESDPDKHFYLCEYVDIIEELPDITKFSTMLAKLHRDSMDSEDSPGKHGFHIMTHEGSMTQDVTTWCDTWEELFKRRFQSFVDQERVSLGPSEELDKILPEFIEKIIPRLLRPLITHGRSIKPAVLHGDIWFGNIGTNAKTGEPLYFDPSVFWGHNEFDVGSMATPRYKLGLAWIREYQKIIPISPPEEDFDDRNALYAVSGHFCASTLYPANKHFRKQAIEEMKMLLSKYPNGYQDE